MNLKALKASIKSLDPTGAPAISDAERDYFRHYNINFEETTNNLRHHFGHLDCDRFDLVVHYFELEGAEGTCFILHGYFDHSGLFRHIIDFCLQRRLSVVIFDLPGHGLSSGERGAISSFQDYQVALTSVLSFFEKVAPTPWHGIAQSTGAAILMDFMLSGGEEVFEKVVLLAPLYRPVGWASGRWVHALAYPWIKRIKRKFQPNSHDEVFLEFLRDRDPLQYRFLSLVWVAALKKWLPHFDRLPDCEFSPLIIQGKRDTTVDWQANLPVIQKKFPRAKVFFLQEGFHHLANESEEMRNKIFSAIDLYFDGRRVNAG